MEWPSCILHLYLQHLFMFKILHNCTSLVPLNRTSTLMQNLKENCKSIHQTIMAKVNQETPVHHKGWMVGGQETLSIAFQFLS
jgi:hypothetical protein